MTRVLITNDWSLDLGDGDGDLDRRVDEAGDLVLRGGGRSVYASVFHTTNAAAEAAIGAMLEGREQAPVRTFDRAAFGLIGRAYLLREGQHTGDGYWGLNTWTASPNSVACVTFYFGGGGNADLDWALDAWRSVQCGTCERYVN